jgi:hypothetical protein
MHPYRNISCLTSIALILTTNFSKTAALYYQKYTLFSFSCQRRERRGEPMQLLVHFIEARNPNWFPKNKKMLFGGL